MSDTTPDPGLSSSEGGLDTPAAISGTCAACGLPGHRYGSTDREHEPQLIACINMLRAEIERLSGPVGESVQPHPIEVGRLVITDLIEWPSDQQFRVIAIADGKAWVRTEAGVDTFMPLRRLSDAGPVEATDG